MQLPPHVLINQTVITQTIGETPVRSLKVLAAAITQTYMAEFDAPQGRTYVFSIPSADQVDPSVLSLVLTNFFGRYIAIEINDNWGPNVYTMRRGDAEVTNIAMAWIVP